MRTLERASQSFTKSSAEKSAEKPNCKRLVNKSLKEIHKVANHIHLASKDLAAAVNNEPQPIVRSTDHRKDSDVVGVAKHLNSNPQTLVEFANPEYDTESHFSRPEKAKNLRAHLPAKEEQR
jgi:hypothetical protein